MKELNLKKNARRLEIKAIRTGIKAGPRADLRTDKIEWPISVAKD